MQAMLVKDFVPQGSRRNVVVCVSWIWETIDHQQNVYELGSLSLTNYYLLNIEVLDPSIIYLHMRSKQLAWPYNLISYQCLLIL
jgi:hypothetical protein